MAEDKNKDAAVTKLGVSPREIEIVSTKDGGTRVVKDDGGAVTRDGFIPHPFRQSLMRKMVLLNRDPDTRENTDVPAFVVKTAISPMFQNDPLARFPVLTPAIQKVIDENVAARAAKLDDNRTRALAEAKQLGANEFVQTIVEKAIKDGLAAAATSKKEAKA